MIRIKCLSTPTKPGTYTSCPPQDYEKLLNENITRKYKTARNEVIDNIADEFEEIAQQLDISERIDCTTTKPAFVTLKDHKENFRNNPQVRLINP